MKARLALLLVLALVAVGMLVPAVAQANDEAIDYIMPAWVGFALPGADAFPGPNLNEKVEVEPGLYQSFFEWMGYPRDPQVHDGMTLYVGWGTFGKGQALTVPKKARLMLDVYYNENDPADADELVWSVPLDQAKGYWQEPFIVPPPDLQPFNPRIGAAEWVVLWMVSHVFAEPGWYAVHFYCDWVRPTNDLTAVSGEDGWLDKFAGHLHYQPGDGLGGDGVTDGYFHFYVAE